MPATIEAPPGFTLEEFNPGYFLYSKQLAFIRARQSFTHRRFVGGRQSGKTDVGAAESVLFSVHFRPGGTGAIIGPDFPRAQEARDRFNSMCPYEWRSWNGSERRWTIQNPHGGSPTIIHWMSLSDPDSARGKVLDWAWLDECAMYSQEAMDNLRPALMVRNGHSWGTTTPKGMNWLEKETHEPDVFFVHAESRENPAFPESEWEKAIKRHGYDSPFFKQEYRGLFQAFIGQAIPMFDRSRHANRELVSAFDQEALHVAGWDFGWTAPTVKIWFQIDTATETWTIRGCKLWTETERQVILAQSQFSAMNGTRPAWHAIDPSGAAGRAREAGDKGWQYDMERAPRNWDVRTNRRVTETRRLNLVRQLVTEGRLQVDPDGEGCEHVIHAFETAELDANPEKDRLKENQHPQADIIDAIGYPIAEVYGAGSKQQVRVY